MDDLLDDVTLYWVTNSVTTALRLSKEVELEDERLVQRYCVTSVPVVVPRDSVVVVVEKLIVDLSYQLT